jgi:AraC-like DNA-binding protein
VNAKPGLRRAGSAVSEIDSRIESLMEERRRAWAEEESRARSVVASDPLAEDLSESHAAFVAAIDSVHEKTIDGTFWSRAKIATALGISAGYMSRLYNYGDKEMCPIQFKHMRAVRRALPACAWAAAVAEMNSWCSPSSLRAVSNG